MSTITIQSDLTPEDVSRLSQSSYIAVDTETTGLKPTRDLLCLVQICDENDVVTVVKTRDWSACNGLREILSNDNIIKVIHYALFDCGFLQQNLGIEINNLYCTRTASKLARTYSGSHSLKTVLSELLDVSLDKTQQTTFWCGDDLTDDQIAYASADVRYLIPLQLELNKILEVKGKLPSGISYVDLNSRCQQAIPTLVHLKLNGWEMPRDQSDWIF